MEVCDCCGEMRDEVALETCSSCGGKCCYPCREVVSLHEVYCDLCKKGSDDA